MTNQYVISALEYARELRAEGITWEADDCPIRETDGRDLVALANEIERLQAALNAAGYALFQIKRMVPEAIVAFAKAEHAKVCAVLDGDAVEPSVQCICPGEYILKECPAQHPTDEKSTACPLCGDTSCDRLHPELP